MTYSMVRLKDEGTPGTISDMQKKEKIQVITEKERAEEVKFLTEMVELARHLNKYGAKSVSNSLPGSQMIHGMMRAEKINNRMYHDLLRVIEDPTIEYEFE